MQELRASQTTGCLKNGCIWLEKKLN
jgi:hypothetical protein